MSVFIENTTTFYSVKLIFGDIKQKQLFFRASNLANELTLTKEELLKLALIKFINTQTSTDIDEMVMFNYKKRKELENKNIKFDKLYI